MNITARRNYICNYVTHTVEDFSYSTTACNATYINYYCYCYYCCFLLMELAKFCMTKI